MKRDITDKTREVRNHKNRDKQEEAETRQTDKDQLSNEKQIKILDDRLGVGIGAAKERRRLMS